MLKRFMAAATRTEKDTFGPLEVPADRWAAGPGGALLAPCSAPAFAVALAALRTMTVPSQSRHGGCLLFQHRLPKSGCTQHSRRTDHRL